MRTLYAKLALVLGAIVVAVGLAYLIASQALTKYYNEIAYQQFNRDLARNLVADRSLVTDGRLDKDAIKETFELYMTINPSIEIYLLDEAGNIAAYSADPGAVKRRRVSLTPIRAFLSDSPQFPILGDDPRSHDRQKSFSVTPLPSAEQPEGYLYVVLRGEMYASLERWYQDSLLLRLSLWTLLGSLLFGLLTGLVVFYFLTRRLRRLTHLMADFRDSRFQRYQPYQGAGADGDEIERLGASFDLMAMRMQNLVAELNARDELRRELVNNVSHDLRTPLTCLHGYLETLKLKGSKLAAAEQTRYLDLALGHSNRLGRLIGELFELAKLDARAVKPNPEPFSPAELLQDIGQKFSLAARQKGIRLNLSLPEQRALAQGDVGMIERVLENLIANALNHTEPNGKVFLHMSRDDHTISLSVQDTGCGIAPEDLRHVFNRFHRGKRQADGAGPSGLGLGLAIAKRIVELHQSEIRVASRVDKGTRFTFDLPIWQPGRVESA